MTSLFLKQHNNDQSNDDDVDTNGSLWIGNSQSSFVRRSLDDVDDRDSTSIESHHCRSHRHHRDSTAEVQVPFIGVTLRGKYQIKAALQTALFCSVVVGYSVVNNMYTDTNGTMVSDGYDLSLSSTSSLSSPSFDNRHRLLQDDNSTSSSCDDLRKAEPGWFAVWYSIGVLYMFLALAIVCDEFFVPALEEMSSPRRLNLSMDVAGK